MDKILKEVKDLHAVHLLIALAAGLILYLAPNDAKSIFLSIMLRELFVFIVAFITTVVILMMFKDYRVVGLAVAIFTILACFDIIVYNINLIFQNINLKQAFFLSMDTYDTVCFMISCFVPFAICLIVRVFSIAKWDIKNRRKQFKPFFYLCTISFLAYYILIYSIYFVFPKPVDLFSSREFSLIPFQNVNSYWPNYGAAAYIFANIAFFIPAGFFVSVYKQNLGFKKEAVIALTLAVSTELLQLIFNTACVNFEDAILCFMGFMLGTTIRFLIAKCRNYIIQSSDDDIFAFLRSEISES